MPACQRDLLRPSVFVDAVVPQRTQPDQRRTADLPEHGPAASDLRDDTADDTAGDAEPSGFSRPRLRLALGELAPNGVLVTWLTTRILVPLPSAGEAVEVNGATGRLQIEKPGSCSAVVADETLDVLVPIGQPKPRPNIAVVACLRGPDLADAEAKVRAMLASAKVSPWEAGGPRAQLED